MGRKRRGSQAFAFEQSEETLLQNENLLKLYKNETFEPPEPKPLETIREEGVGETAKRAKRGETHDGVLVLGLSKERRIISDYKFWKQDDKEKNRKRKIKISKQWKGRKKSKPRPLDCALEQRLIDLIADRVSSDEEDSDCEESALYLSRQCVWKASDNLSATTSLCASVPISTSPSLSLSMDDLAPSPTSSPQRFSEPDTSLEDQVSAKKVKQPSDDEAPNENDVLSELQGLIPESELAELLQCEDLLFCSKQNKNKTEPLGPVPVNIDIERKEEKKDSRRSVRRSARIMSVPNLTGSVFTSDADRDEEEQENLNPGEETRSKKAKTSKKPAEGDPVQVLKKKKTKKCTPQGTEVQPDVLKDVSNLEDSQDQVRRKRKENPGLAEKPPSVEDPAPAVVKNKRRKSYSLEEGGSRYSLDGSRRNR